MTKILVTGGAGYIGSHTISELVNANGSLVKEKLGWEAQETLEQAMISAWEWGKLKE